MRIALLGFLFFCSCANAQAEYNFGKQHLVKNDALEFEVSELFIDGKFVGYVYGNTPPIKFSKNYYVYASCPTDKSTGKPNGYCIEWMIYDISKKAVSAVTLPGLTYSSIPSFHWPYVAYVKVPKTITREDFENRFVRVSCVAIEWTSRNVAARNEVKVDVGHFETDVPGSFLPPKFFQNKDALHVSCSESSDHEEGHVISTMTIPTSK